jgi:osmotically-inducible protein OsmY
MSYAEELILQMVKRPEFTLTPDKRPAFQDFLIKSRIYATLAASLVGRLSLITVTVTNGVVRLQGTLTSNESLIESIVDEIQKMEGVKAVNNEIVVGLVYQEWNV